MSVLLSFSLLWAQVAPTSIPVWLRPTIAWLFVLGEPAFTQRGLFGSFIVWLKVVSLFCLLAWVVSWLITALKQRRIAYGSWLDIAALAAVLGGVASVLLRVLETTERMPVVRVGPTSIVGLLGVSCALIVFFWVEAGLWRTIRRHGHGADLAVLAGIHAALLLGLAVGFVIQRASGPAPEGAPETTWRDAVIYGVRLGATYMGYVVLLRVALQVLGEVVNVRRRRLAAIARLAVTESNRRMWAPWVVMAVFLVILAFTHWFLEPPRPAEMGRLFVGSLTLLCSLLLTVMVTILTPLSLPQDIQHQTIYTVVSKPVRRIELIWGRLIGFMTIVTLLVLVFGAISLLYLGRTVGGAIAATEELASKEAKRNNTVKANQLREQAEQLQTRMRARVPVLGSLTFLDSLGNPHFTGIDVGQEQRAREPRSHIEGATPATAVWNYGYFPDPYNARVFLDRRIPVSDLLAPDSVEGLLDQSYNLKYEIALATQEQSRGNPTAARAKQLEANLARFRAQLTTVEAALKDLNARARDLEETARETEKQGKPTEAATIRQQASALHSPPVTVEMTFNVYRTTKGRVGEPVYAELQVTNPNTGMAPYRNIFPIREYYTNKQLLPARVLAGSRGTLKVEIRCISPTQYLGMSESDLYILVDSGNFHVNFMKGLFCVWLQAMVLTAIGVFAGTFLSWPVALLTTVAFVVAGQVAFNFLLSFSQHTLLGGGPFESLIRLLTHENQMSELSPTVAVVTAKTLDSLVMPIMSRLVYIVPNFPALDVSNTVADGFAVNWDLLASNVLLTLAYVVPFSIAGYFILKNREVAA
jgi:ABC-type transport system involved in multi-copper enzyme maturation permease subunit